jgi:hypothetical protein
VEQGLHVDGEHSYAAPDPDDDSDDLSAPLLLPAAAAPDTAAAAAFWAALIRPALSRMDERMPTMTMEDDSRDDSERSATADRWAAVRHRLGRAYQMAPPPPVVRRYSRSGAEEEANRRQLQAEYFGNIMIKRRCLFTIQVGTVPANTVQYDGRIFANGNSAK